MRSLQKTAMAFNNIRTRFTIKLKTRLNKFVNYHRKMVFQAQ